MLKKFLGAALSLALLAALAFPTPSRAADLAIDGNLRGLCDTATASAGAATLANKCGVITSESLTTIAGSDYTLTLTNTVATAGDIVLFSVENGTNTAGNPTPGRSAASANSIVFVVKNLVNGGAGLALNGTIRVKYLLVKP